MLLWRKRTTRWWEGIVSSSRASRRCTAERYDYEHDHEEKREEPHWPTKMATLDGRAK
jgi:hypothetical protein